MFSHILFPIKLTREAREAIQLAADMVKTHHIQLTILSIALFNFLDAVEINVFFALIAYTVPSIFQGNCLSDSNHIRPKPVTNQ
ncbi:MAG: hypothetical protein AAFQ80_14440 [Cyanobacteria bacterium J06621_8]